MERALAEARAEGERWQAAAVAAEAERSRVSTEATAVSRKEQIDVATTSALTGTRRGNLTNQRLTRVHKGQRVPDQPSDQAQRK
eukprot:8834162-Pyramimonas_sp.AAC.1